MDVHFKVDGDGEALLRREAERLQMSVGGFCRELVFDGLEIGQQFHVGSLAEVIRRYVNAAKMVRRTAAIAVVDEYREAHAALMAAGKTMGAMTDEQADANVAGEVQPATKEATCRME